MRNLIIALFILLSSSICFSQQIVGRKPLLGAQINSSHPLAQGFRGFWLFNEGSGLKVFDLSLNGHDGILTNMDEADWIPGRDGWALDFDGSNDYIDFEGASLSTHTYDEFTLSVWHKSNDSATSDDETFWLHRSDAGGIILTFRIDDGSDSAPDDNTMSLIIKIGDQRLYNSNSTVMDQVWNNLVVVRDKANITFYKNSVEDGIIADLDAGTSIVVDGSTTGPFIADFPGSTEQLDGALSDFKFYDRALTAEEITALYINPYAMFDQSLYGRVLAAAARRIFHID